MSAGWTAFFLTAGLVLVLLSALVVLLRTHPAPRPPLEVWAIGVGFGLGCWLLPAVWTAWQVWR